MEDETKLIIDDLNRQYKVIINHAESDWDFFWYIAGYVKLIKENSPLQIIVSGLEKIRCDQTNLIKYKRQSLQELGKIKNILISRIRKENNFSKAIRDLLVDLESYSGENPDDLFSIISKIESALKDEELNELMEDIYVIGTETPVVRFRVLSKAYDLFTTEKERIEGIIKTEKELGFSGAWDKLELVYFLIFEEQDYFKKNVLKPGVIFNVENFVKLTSEIKRLKNGLSSSIFRRDKYKRYINGVHNNIIDKAMKAGSSILKQVSPDLEMPIRLTKKSKSELKTIFDVQLDETRKIFIIDTPSGKEEFGFKKKKIEKEDKRFIVRQEALNEAENDRSETKFYKSFAAFFDMKKEVEKFEEKESIIQGQSIESLANMLKTNDKAVRNYITRIRGLFSKNNLPIKLSTDNRGNYQMIVRITKIHTKK